MGMVHIVPFFTVRPCSSKSVTAMRPSRETGGARRSVSRNTHSA